jgi:hypothetical protein
MNRRFELLIYYLCYLAFAVIGYINSYFLTTGSVDPSGLDTDVFRNMINSTYAFSIFATLTVFAVLMYCNLLCKRYNAMVMNTFLATALLCLNTGLVSMSIKAGMLVASVLLLLLVVYMNMWKEESL